MKTITINADKRPAPVSFFIILKIMSGWLSNIGILALALQVFTVIPSMGTFWNVIFILAIGLRIEARQRRLSVHINYEPATYSTVSRIFFAAKMRRRFGYDWVHEANEGMAIAEKDGKMFHIIEKNGKPAYEARYDEVENFKNGHARVYIKNETFLIDKTGAVAA